jgi:hypothetical protein
VEIEVVPAGGGVDTTLQPPSTDAATSTESDTAPTATLTTEEGEIVVVDVAVPSGYLDEAFDELKRGRAAVPGDFDGDGDFDMFVGNPGDTSYVLMNESDASGFAFTPGQVLSESDVFWGGVSGDIDGDGDVDLIVTYGGNETNYPGHDRVYLNDGTGHLEAELGSGIEAVRPDGSLFPTYGASAHLWDLDLDGTLDLFVNRPVNPAPMVGNVPDGEPTGMNGFFQGFADGTFLDIGRELGMYDQWSTRSSTAIDFDNDGDQDLFENNWVGPNRLWRNELVETGELHFTEVTREFGLGGADLSWPKDKSSQAAIAADFNQDGFDDLIVFRRGEKEPGEPLSHSAGHLLWINVDGQGFVEVGDESGVNVDYVATRSHGNVGVMGCQVGDLDADGIPDVFAGNGSPEAGEANHLMVSTGFIEISVTDVGDVVVPTFESWSSLIDIPSEHDGVRHGDVTAFYPYRTHGTSFADLDNDGLYEIAVHNGGPTHYSDEVMQEPNRLFDIRFDSPRHWLRVVPVGDGVTVPIDAVGTRVSARVVDPDGSQRWIYARARSASGFGAQNDPDIFLGLGDAERVEEMVIDWTDGHRDEIEVRDGNRVLRVNR